LEHGYSILSDVQQAVEDAQGILVELMIQE
jgi:hypothetical protein